MIHYNSIDIFEGIDVNKTNESKDYDIYHCWYFLDKVFRKKWIIIKTIY